MNRFTALLTVPAAVLGAVATPTAAQARAEPAYYQVVNGWNDQCLDVWGAATEHAANVGTWRCVGADNQLWYREPAGRFDGKDYFYIRARHTGMCLNVAYWGQENGSDVVQATCSGNTNEQWQLEPIGAAGYVRLIARHSLKCLDKNAGNDAVQWQCWGSGETWQHWRFAYIGGTP
jgi:hypothetical protein